MPLVDMPLSQLKEYKGINPKPKDFDLYWENAINEMEALGTGYTLEPVSFKAPGVTCYDMYFTGVHGARVHAKLLKPVSGNKKPAILSFHGYSGSSPQFSDLLQYTLSGFVVAALDARGQGGKSEDVGGVKGTTYHGDIVRGLDDPDPNKLTFRDIFLDTAQLARIVMAMDDVDDTKVGAFGGSQGGALTLACAALTPKLNRAAPSCPFLCDYKRVWEMDLDIQAYEELRYYFRNFDPLHEREDEIFTKLGYIDNINLAPRIKAKIMMFTGLLDNICPASTQFAAYNRITSPKQVFVYPDFFHEDYAGMHDKIYQFMTEML